MVTPEWNSRQYLKFEKERTQPAVDLANRIDGEVSKIIDIGCGPGNSSKVLADRFPHAYILGVDNSENMIFAAQKQYPNLDFKLCDVSAELSSVGCDYDVVFSNACIQWIPNHKKLLGDLTGLLKKGGVLAIQIPLNFQEPIHKIISEISSAQEWMDYFPASQVFYTLSPGEYFDILSGLSQNIAIWETTYYHIMKTHDDILEWYRGTGLRPYLTALPEDKKGEFENSVMAEIVKRYPKQQNGEIIFRFPRLFFIAYV